MVSSIPAAILGVACARLYSTGTLDVVSNAFFEHLAVEEQMALMCILFSIVFIAVSIAQFIGVEPAGDHGDEDHKPPLQYPLEDIKAATTEKDAFMAVYPMLREEILDHMQNENEMPKEALSWCQEMMDYTVPGGKLNRGLTVVAVHQTLLGRDLTPLETAKASVLGWAIEFLQAFFLVADDVMDDSQTRRGQPCWYKLPKVQNIAINDSFLLESYVFFMIKHHFGDTPYYLQLVELFINVVQKTEFGQLIDLTSQPMDTTVVDLTRFTMERYKLQVKYKTAFYTFYLPVACGMITSGVTSKEAFELASNICCIMGEYFQIQDDYLDCFGDPKVIGKGTIFYSFIILVVWRYCWNKHGKHVLLCWMNKQKYIRSHV
jgi:farnesyl diphosphate synthase